MEKAQSDLQLKQITLLLHEVKRVAASACAQLDGP